jgi:hypothetical protein
MEGDAAGVDCAKARCRDCRQHDRLACNSDVVPCRSSSARDGLQREEMATSPGEGD